MQILKSASFWLLAFACSYAIWLGHDDSAKLPELLAGVVIAAIAATGTELVRRQRVAPMVFRLRWFRHVGRLVLSAVRDCWALTVVAFAQLVDPQPVRGRTVVQSFRYGGDEEPIENGRRAVALGVGSFAPSTIVVGVDPDSELVVTHQLAASGKPSDLDPLELG